jgi:hypothetical protein
MAEIAPGIKEATWSEPAEGTYPAVLVIHEIAASTRISRM